MIHDRYIPENSEAIEHPLGVVFNFTNKTGKACAIAYRGNRWRSDWHYSFSSEQRRSDYIAQWTLKLEESEQRRAEARKATAAERARPHRLQVGDIVYNSWGYDQTNIDFYQVVKTSKNFVWLRRIAGETEETGFMCGKTSAVRDAFVGDEVSQHRVRATESSDYVNFEHGAGNKWDGKPKDCSWYA